MSSAKQTITSLLKTAGITVNGRQSYDIQVHDERFYDRVLAGRELAFGESYMDGWWSSKRVDETITRIVSSGSRDKLPISASLVKDYLLARLTNPQKLSRAYRNASAHYDIGNDLYEVMLDKRMVYSCGFWENAKTLDEAQEAKLDRVCQKLHLKKGMTLLDIGCGWGGFAKYAAEKYGVIVTGITPAAEQVKIATQRTKGLAVKILRKDYREITGRYDRVVSIGMLEHVGPKNYRDFFEHCERLLKPGGLMLHHVIGNNRSVKTVEPWINKYIFPGGVIPSITQIGKATEQLLIIEDLENFGPYYDKTLLAWHRNFVKNYSKLPDSYDERFYRMWEYYLLCCAGSFRARQIQLWQFVMRKIEPSETYQAVR